jgi:hypothetical protein
VVEEIIGRLPELSGSQLGRLEDEIRRERQRRASSAGGERALPRSMKAPRRQSRRSWSTVPTRTAICSWSYAATFVATARRASVDPTGTSSSTRVASVRSSTSAKPTTRRTHWPPSGQSPQLRSLHLGDQERKALPIRILSAGLALLRPMLGCNPADISAPTHTGVDSFQPLGSSR